MGIRSKIRLYGSVNWIKTLYFNFKKFPFPVARKLPVFFYGPVKFQDISGEVIIDAPIERAMIGFGQQYEAGTIHKGTAELILGGTIVFKGPAQVGKDYLVKVYKESRLEFGYMSGLGSNSMLICKKKITFGRYARIAAEARVTDTDFHAMVDTQTGEKYETEREIIIGNFNYITSRVKIMKGTKTSDYCTVASNSMCNKDYTALGENILIGGMPAKLLKTHITRDWEGEMHLMQKWLRVKYRINLTFY